MRRDTEGELGRCKRDWTKQPRESAGLTEGRLKRFPEEEPQLSRMNARGWVQDPEMILGAWKVRVEPIIVNIVGNDLND